MDVGDEEVHPPIHGRDEQCAPASRPNRDIQHATALSVKDKRSPRSGKYSNSTPRCGAQTDIVDTSIPGPPPRSTLPGVLKRRQSCTMPGSLFSRSPSMDPDSNQADLRVRFLADCEASSSSGPRHDHDPGEDNIPGPSSRLRSQSPLDTDRMGKLHRKPFVKAVVDKFRLSEKDADPSILLPSPTNSPGKGKIFSSGQFQSEQTGGGGGRWKGKQRAVSPVQEHGENPRNPLLRGKEKELDFVREEQRKHERSWEHGQDDLHDKERIRMLEEEIQRLKTEVSLFWVSHFLTDLLVAFPQVCVHFRLHPSTPSTASSTSSK